MGMIGAVSDRFVRGNNQVMMNQTRSSNYAGAIQAMIKPLQNTIQVLIYCAGAYYAMKEGFNVGLMVAASIIMGRGLAPLMQLMGSWQAITQAKEAFQRLQGLSTFLELQDRSMSLPEPKGQVTVENAVYKIQDRVLLNGVSFALQPGEFLGIIGPNGAGKTTLCRLLARHLAILGRQSLPGRQGYFCMGQRRGRLLYRLPAPGDRAVSRNRGAEYRPAWRGGWKGGDQGDGALWHRGNGARLSPWAGNPVGRRKGDQAFRGAKTEDRSGTSGLRKPQIVWYWMNRRPILMQQGEQQLLNALLQIAANPSLHLHYGDPQNIAVAIHGQGLDAGERSGRTFRSQRCGVCGIGQTSGCGQGFRMMALSPKLFQVFPSSQEYSPCSSIPCN